MLGLGLYWGEGNKTGGFGISNSDVEIARIFIDWSKKYFEINSFSAHIQHYNQSEDELVKKWWSDNLFLPLELFGKSNFSVSLLSKRKRNTLLYGTIRLRAKGDGWKCLVKYRKAIDMTLSSSGRILASQAGDQSSNLCRVT